MASFLPKEQKELDSLIAIIISPKLVDSTKASTYNKLGLFYSKKDEYKTAIDYFKKALKTSDILKDSIRVAEYTTNLAVSAFKIGDYYSAIDLLFIALRRHETNNNKIQVARIYSQLGDSYGLLKDLKKSEEYFQKALKLLNTLDTTSKNLKTMFGTVYTNMGENLLANEGKYKLALESEFKAIKYFEESGDKEKKLFAFVRVGKIYTLMGENKSAIPFFEKVLEVFSNDKGVTIRTEAFCLSSIGEAYTKMGDFSKAKKILGRGAMLSDSLLLLGMQKKNYFALYKLYDTIGDKNKALSYFVKYYNCYERQLKQSTSQMTTSAEIKYEFEKKEVKEKAMREIEVLKAKVNLDNEKIVRNISIGSLLLAVLIAIFIFNRLKINQSQKKIIQEQHSQVSIQHKEITDSINYAERIQRSFLATDEFLNENLKDFFVLFQPKDIVSGDFYWASKLQNDNFLLVTADSTGHGVPGAIMSLLNITSLEKSIEIHTNPNDIFNSTRKIIIDRLKKDGSKDGGKDGMDASLISFDFKNNKFTYSAANNPIWVVRENQIIELEPDKMPVGKHDRDYISFTQTEFELKKNDVVYTLTDGMPDQFGGPKGKKFMYKKLKELLISIAHEPMEQQKQILINTLNTWKGNLEQVDDVTLIGVRI